MSWQSCECVFVCVCFPRVILGLREGTNSWGMLVFASGFTQPREKWTRKSYILLFSFFLSALSMQHDDSLLFLAATLVQNYSHSVDGPLCCLWGRRAKLSHFPHLSITPSDRCCHTVLIFLSFLQVTVATFPHSSPTPSGYRVRPKHNFLTYTPRWMCRCSCLQIISRYEDERSEVFSSRWPWN